MHTVLRCRECQGEEGKRSGCNEVDRAEMGGNLDISVIERSTVRNRDRKSVAAGVDEHTGRSLGCWRAAAAAADSDGAVVDGAAGDGELGDEGKKIRLNLSWWNFDGEG